MLVLVITLVPMVSFADTYVADDTYTMTSQYHDVFNNYFSPWVSYQYFSYDCVYGSYARQCYLGIDSEGNYLKINYVQDGNNYVVNYQEGVDEDFSVSGINVFKKGIDVNSIIAVAVIFFGLLFFVKLLCL